MSECAAVRPVRGDSCCELPLVTEAGRRGSNYPRYISHAAPILTTLAERRGVIGPVQQLR